MDLLWGSTWCLLSAWTQRADFRPVLTQIKVSQAGSPIWPLQPVECGKKRKKNKSEEFAGREWPFLAPSSLILRLCVRACELRGVPGEVWQFTLALVALMITLYSWLSRISLCPQSVLPLPYLPIKRRQEHRRSHDIRKHKNSHGSAQRCSQAVLAFASQFRLKSCHIMATLPELEIDTEAQWDQSTRSINS